MSSQTRKAFPPISSSHVVSEDSDSGQATSTFSAVNPMVSKREGSWRDLFTLKSTPPPPPPEVVVAVAADASLEKPPASTKSRRVPVAIPVAAAVLLIVGAIIIGAVCGTGHCSPLASSSPAYTAPLPAPVAVLSGSVLDALSGAPLPGMLVTSTTSPTGSFTDSNGVFTGLGLAADGVFTVNPCSGGYCNTSYPTHYASLTLVSGAFAVTTTIDLAPLTSVAFPASAGIAPFAVSPNAFISVPAAPGATGTLTLRYGVVPPTAGPGELRSAAPGPISNSTLLRSLFMAYVDVLDANGAPHTSTAPVISLVNNSFPEPAAIEGAADEPTWWWFDAAVGAWVPPPPAATGRRLTHFASDAIAQAHGYWNSDGGIREACTYVRVVDSSGNPCTGATLTAVGVDSIVTRGVVDGSGTVCVNGPASVWAGTNIQDHFPSRLSVPGAIQAVSFVTFPPTPGTCATTPTECGNSGLVIVVNAGSSCPVQPTPSSTSTPHATPSHTTTATPPNAGTGNETCWTATSLSGASTSCGGPVGDCLAAGGAFFTTPTGALDVLTACDGATLGTSSLGGRTYTFSWPSISVVATGAIPYPGVAVANVTWAFVVGGSASCSAQVSFETCPTPSNSPSPSATMTPTMTMTSTASGSALPSTTASASPASRSATATAAPTTPQSTASSSLTASTTLTASATPTTSASPSVTPSMTATSSVTPTITNSNTMTPTMTASSTTTPTQSPSSSTTPSHTPSGSASGATHSTTGTPAGTPSNTPTPSATPSLTPTATMTATMTMSSTMTATASPTRPSQSRSASATMTAAETRTPTLTPTASTSPRNCWSASPLTGSGCNSTWGLAVCLAAGGTYAPSGSGNNALTMTDAAPNCGPWTLTSLGGNSYTFVYSGLTGASGYPSGSATGTLVGVMSSGSGSWNFVATGSSPTIVCSSTLSAAPCEPPSSTPTPTLSMSNIGTQVASATATASNVTDHTSSLTHTMNTTRTSTVTATKAASASTSMTATMTATLTRTRTV